MEQALRCKRLCASTHLGGEARVVHAQQHLVGIAHSACSTRSGAAKGTDNAVKGTEDAVKGTDNAVKGTEDAVKGMDNAAKGTDDVC